MELSEKDEEYVISLLKQGKKVEAIAFVKDKTGMTLKEAKDYIDKKINNEYYNKNLSISEEDEKHISSLINENKKLQAVAFLHKSKNMSLLEAKNYIDLYFSRYPKVKEYMDRMVQEAHETGKVRTMFGRQRELPDINSRNFNRRSFAERTAMNTPIQGTAADIIKLAMNQVEQKLEEQNFKSRLLLQVHDELVLEVVNSELEVIEELLRSTMQSVVELQVPLIVDVHHAENWALVK